MTTRYTLAPMQDSLEISTNDAELEIYKDKDSAYYMSISSSAYEGSEARIKLDWCGAIALRESLDRWLMHSEGKCTTPPLNCLEYEVDWYDWDTKIKPALAELGLVSGAEGLTPPKYAPDDFLQYYDSVS